MYYFYDGAGRRVQEVSTYNVEKVFVYDAFGQMAAEYSIGAQSLPCTTCYIATDHLGSTRMVTDQNANVVGRHDYLPFGEEIAANTGGRNSNFGTQDFVNQKFTSQERDGETGLDFFQARYFSAALGRFNSPDPGNAGASLFNPQSWNAYTYVRNNPLVLIDPTGMCDSKNPSCFSIDTSACKWWQIWCWAGGSSGSESGAITPIIPLSLCCQYVIGEPSGPVEQQKGQAPDFRSNGSVSPKAAAQNNAPVCFAQLKSRPVNDPRAAKVWAVHTFWWVQGSTGQQIISGGPLPPSGTNQHLTVWVNPNLYQGPDTPKAHLVFNSGLSSDACGQVDSMINAGQAFPNGSLIYDPVWGPNSNTAARYFGDIGGFNPSFPFNAYGANAPLLVP